MNDFVGSVTHTLKRRVENAFGETGTDAMKPKA
jgi:hypothetical protein